MSSNPFGKVQDLDKIQSYGDKDVDKLLGKETDTATSVMFSLVLENKIKDAIQYFRKEIIDLTTVFSKRLDSKADHNQMVSSFTVVNSKIDKHCMIVLSDPETASTGDQWILYTPADGQTPASYELSLKTHDGSIKRLTYA